MSYSASTYRKERYSSSHRSTKKDHLLRWIVVVILLIAACAFALLQFKKSEQLSEKIVQHVDMLTQYEEELSILRTLNPYHVGSNEVLAKAVENIDLLPGWVTRVYPVPKHNKALASGSDLGSFILNETRFSLSSHKSYGIPQPSKSMYRLNGIFPSHKSGRLQVGVEFYLTNNKGRNEDAGSQIASCYARIDINQKRVIDKKLHLVTKSNHEQVLTGEIEMAKGLFPISAMLYCDEKSDFNGDNVEVSISFRNPGQYNLSTERNSVFHIYKPQNMTASL